MTQINPAGVCPLISRNRAGAAINAAIRLWVGRGRRYSVKQVANATGIKDRVIECAMCDPDSEDWRPLPAEALLSLASFLGPEFTTEWLQLAHQGAFTIPDTDETPPGALAADSADDAAAVTRAALDGAFSRDERPGLSVVGARMMARGAQLRALGRAA